MAKPNTLVLTGYGINCNDETAWALDVSGANAEQVHIEDIIDGHKKLKDYQIFVFPGGFSFGDDIAAGKVLAVMSNTGFGEQLHEFIEEGKLMMGFCNGFQAMVKMGILPGFDHYKQTATLMGNDSNQYEDRWVHLRPAYDSLFTRGIKELDSGMLYIPVAHGEGKFYAKPEELKKIEDSGLVVLRYSHPDGTPAKGSYPENPNGSLNDIVGIRNPKDNVFGIMPHPERFLNFTNHPQWTFIKEKLKREGRRIPNEGDGRIIFENAVNYFR